MALYSYAQRNEGQCGKSDAEIVGTTLPRNSRDTLSVAGAVMATKGEEIDYML